MVSKKIKEDYKDTNFLYLSATGIMGYAQNSVKVQTMQWMVKDSEDLLTTLSEKSREGEVVCLLYKQRLYVGKVTSAQPTTDGHLVLVQQVTGVQYAN